jgi:hypothetical protein
MQTYEETIGIQEIGRRLSELKMEGVLVEEKPSQYYPLYYILDKAPYGIAKQFSGEKEPYDFYNELSGKENIEYCDWIKSTGIKSGLVLDLHDNTTHPDVLPYVEGDYLKYKTARRMPDGSVAARVDHQIEASFYSDSSRLQVLEDVMDAFKSSTRVKVKMGFDDLKKWGEIPESDITVVLEYYPLRIKAWPDALETMSIEKGLGFTSSLISFLQRNYARYTVSFQNT